MWLWSLGSYNFIYISCPLCEEITTLGLNAQQTKCETLTISN